MARTVSEIYASLVEAKEAESGLDGLTSVSASAIWRLFLYIQAAAISIHEQYIDTAKLQVEETIKGAAPNNSEWIRQRCFDFQYNLNNPQTPIIDENYNVTYTTINEDYQIVTRCSVITELDRTVSIKAAKNEPPEAMTTAEANSLKGFVEAFSVPGIIYNLISLDSDKVYVEADVYYDTIYSAVIKDNVEASIAAYFKALSDTDFDGLMYVAKLQDSIQAVEGVRDVNLKVIKARANSVVFASADVIYDLSSSINERFYNPLSGYLETEDTSGYELSDSLNYIPK